MAALKSVRLFCPLWSFVRHASKPNIQKTRLPHWIRLQVLETCKPMFEPKERPDSVTCEKIDQSLHTVEPEMSKYEFLLGQDAIRKMDESKLIGLYHQNSIRSRQLNEIRRTLYHNKMSLANYDVDILKKAFKDTKYAALGQLFDNGTVMILSKEPDVKLLLKLQKKMPELILLGAIVDDKLLSRETIEWYGNLPDLDVVRSHLCSTLSALSVQLTSNLSYHQTQLCQSLASLAANDKTPAAGEGNLVTDTTLPGTQVTSPNADVTSTVTEKTSPST